jgi:non-canonical (house-cleaning) NTP pyrophosphatase
MPMTDRETMEGARLRARTAMKADAAVSGD